MRDWDLTGDDEFIGMVNVPVDRIRGLPVERRPNVTTFPILTKDGKKVVGYDKFPSVLTVSLAPLEEASNPASSGGESEPNVRGSLWVTVKGASGLPKMDFLSQKADPFMIFILDGEQVHKTAVKHATLNPVWEERFEVRCTSGKATIIAQVFQKILTIFNFTVVVHILSFADGRLQLEWKG